MVRTPSRPAVKLSLTGVITAHAGVETRTRPRSWSTSAICTALVAAPLSRLSETTHRCSPRSCDGSRRMRPTSTSSWPAAERAVGQRAGLLGLERLARLDVDRLRVRVGDGHARARDGDPDRLVAEDLARL